MKKMLIITAVVLVLSGFVLLVLTSFSFRVLEFDLNDYSREMENFPFDETLGKIKSVKDAQLKAKKIFVNVYDDGPILPLLETKYDNDSDTWLICQKNLIFWGKGGFPHVIIRGYDGKVLALWHDK